MEALLRGGILIVPPDWTGVPRATALFKTNAHPRLPSQKRPTATHVEHSGRQGIGRTSRQTRLPLAAIASMTARHLARCRQGAIKAQRAAITVPEAVARVDENAERRRFQPFRPHCPLLEGLPRRIGREIGRRPRRLRHRQDHPLRPIVERIHTAAIRFILSPAAKRLPSRSADIADEDHARRSRTAVE